MVFHWNANNKYTNSQNFKLLNLKSSYYVSYFGCIKERSIETKGAYLIFSWFCSRFERYICSRRNSYDVISHTKDSNRIPANKNRPVHKASHLLHPDSSIHTSLDDFLALKCLFVFISHLLQPHLFTCSALDAFSWNSRWDEHFRCTWSGQNQALDII